VVKIVMSTLEAE